MATTLRRRNAANAAKAADSTAVRALARAGIASRGVLYLLVAVLAARVAAGDYHGRSDKDGALSTIAHQPFGRVLVALLAVAFAGYTIWRLCEAVFGFGEDDGAKGWAKRLAALGKAGLYVVLCTTAISYTAGRSRGGQTRERDITARVMAWPMGRWVVGAAGVALIAGGLYNGYRGLARTYRKRLKTQELSAFERRLVHGLAVAGMTARLVVYVMIGWFVLRAAVRFDPQEAIGIDGALRRLAAATHGPWVLGGVAAGLFAYGVYTFVEAKYRKILDD